MIQHECQNPGVWFFRWKLHSQFRLFRKLIILLTVFSIHQNYKKLEIPSGVWNCFGLQMDLDSPLEGRLEEEVEEEEKIIFRFYF
jgi:hypothetical protein